MTEYKMWCTMARVTLKNRYYLDRSGKPRDAQTHHQLGKSTSLDELTLVWSRAEADSLGVPYGTPVETTPPTETLTNKVETVAPPVTTPAAPPEVTTPTTPETTTPTPPDWADPANLDPHEVDPSAAPLAPQEAEPPPLPPPPPPPAAEPTAGQAAALAAAQEQLTMVVAGILGGSLARLAVVGSDAEPIPLTAPEEVALAGAIKTVMDYYAPDFQPGPATMLVLVCGAITAPRLAARRQADAKAAAEAN